MKAVIALLFVLCGCALAVDNWAILVAGSNTYSNYRHQSDVFHAYHILKDKGGFPEDHIVLMAYDDIANNSQNPVKGNVINKPNGDNVYANIKISYKGADVTAAKFLAVLDGTATPYAIHPTANDNVFIYYSDHGAAGLVAMPTGADLYADQLMTAIKTLKTNNKFHQMVLYIEACESGSMCQNLPSTLSTYCTTASNPSESSYAFYYDSTRGTYLGDEYSIQWMEDSDVASMGVETLAQQFTTVQSKTKGSHVMQYGDTGMASLPIGIFQAYHKTTQQGARAEKLEVPDPLAAVSSRDVNLAIAQHRLEDAKKYGLQGKMIESLQQAVEVEITARKAADNYFRTLIEKVTGAPADVTMVQRHEVKNFECLRTVNEAIRMSCGKFSDYALKYVYTIANMCEDGHDGLTVANTAFQLCQSTGFKF